MDLGKGKIYFCVLEFQLLLKEILGNEKGQDQSPLFRFCECIYAGSRKGRVG